MDDSKDIIEEITGKVIQYREKEDEANESIGGSQADKMIKAIKIYNIWAGTSKTSINDTNFLFFLIDYISDILTVDLNMLKMSYLLDHKTV